MKRASNLYKGLFDIELINDTYKQIKRATKNRRKIYVYEEMYTYHITNVLNKLKCYNPIYNIFLIKENKYRIIMSLNIEDKIVNHLVGNALIKVLDSTLINTNVATRKNKGTHYGIKYVKKYLNELKQDNIYALKIDISKYFYSIDHTILKSLLNKKIKDKDFLNLLNVIIDSTDKDYVNKRITALINSEIKKVKGRKLINELKHVPIYKKGRGLPIGNLTSQILAVFFLNEMHHYLKENLKIKHLIVYMDDYVILSNSKEYLKEIYGIIRDYMYKYKLKLNDKTKIVNINKEGLDFLGFRFYIKNNKIIMKVRNRTKKKFKKSTNINSIKSYKSHFKWGTCHNLYNKYVKKY